MSELTDRANAEPSRRGHPLSIRGASVNLCDLFTQGSMPQARHHKKSSERAFAFLNERVKGSAMASDAMMQAIGRLERAVTRAETLARQLAEQHAKILEAQLASETQDESFEGSVDIDPFSRDKAIAALKSLDALIGDLQKARSDA